MTIVGGNSLWLALLAVAAPLLLLGKAFGAAGHRVCHIILSLPCSVGFFYNNTVLSALAFSIPGASKQRASLTAQLQNLGRM